MNKIVLATVQAASSLKLTIACLGALMILTFFGTLAQVDLGIYSAQKKYFESFFVTYPFSAGFQLPIFPGGLLVCLILFINQGSALITRFTYRLKNAGLLTSHLGILVLLGGAGFSFVQSTYSEMAIREGETKAYSEDARNSELVLIDETGQNSDKVISIPGEWLAKRKTISDALLPAEIEVITYLPNAELSMDPGVSEAFNLPRATHGIGARIGVKPLPPVSSDDVRNLPTAWVQFKENGESRGIFLLSLGLAASQQVRVGNNVFSVSLRLKRYYNDFALTLKDFKHEKYPGTNIPSHFSSDVVLNDPGAGQEREFLIQMNEPLRYKGKTFYQSSFGENDTLSILQVVDNPSWLFPYVSCGMVAIGLMIHFLMGLSRFKERKK